MSLVRFWPLILAVAPLVWLVWRWRAGDSRWPLLVKALSLSAIGFALCEPQLDISESKMAVGVLVDTSASIPPADLERASRLVADIERARGRHRIRVIPFASSTRPLDPAEYGSGWRLHTSPAPDARATDFESALREAASTLPEGLVPRLVLISDGRETRGTVVRAAYELRSAGVPLDTIALPGRPQPRLHLNSVRVPASAFTGEKFPIEISLTSPAPARGTVDLLAEGKKLGGRDVALETGENLLRVNASVASTGVVEIDGSLTTEQLGDLRFAQAIALRRPKLLYLTMDPPGMEKHLFETLAAAQFDIVSGGDIRSARLDDYQLIVLNNYDLESIPAQRKADLERYVRQGGGLMVIGGERNIYVEKKQPDLDPLDRALPATVAPPRTPEGTVVVLIVDKSSSMEGRKIELARLAAIGVIDNLRSIDQVGVLIFDNSHQWAVPIRRAEDRTLIKRLVAGITPDGGTQIAPALTEAYKKILAAKGVFKHIVLLTDGISEEGDSMSLAREAAAQKVTISTVGLGQDVNRSYLEKVAQFAKGKSYFLTDPSGLEQILLKDVMEHTGSTLVEKQLPAVVVHKAEILEGLGLETAPQLKGYVRFQAKPTAETLMTIDEKEPLLARWQYGLGRAAVFTSDAKSRWAAAWVSWNGFDRFWTNLSRDLLPHAQPGDTEIHYDPASGDLLVEYRLGGSVATPAQPPNLYAFGPESFQSAVDLQRVAGGTYRGKVAIGDRRGLFRVRPLQESPLFPEVGLYRPEEELTAYGNNEVLLKQLAAYTGGRFNPAPKQVFDSGGRAIAGKMNLWPFLLALAILLNLAELTWRKLGDRLPVSWFPSAQRA